MLKFKQLVETNQILNSYQFLTAIKIYTFNPQFVQRSLAGIKNVFIKRGCNKNASVYSLMDEIMLSTGLSMSKTEISNLLIKYNVETENCSSIDEIEFKDEEGSVFIVLNKSFFKRNDFTEHHLVFIERSSTTFLTYNKADSSKNFVYKLSLNDSHKIKAEHALIGTPPVNFIQFALLPKLEKWALNAANLTKTNITGIKSSLQQIDLEEYNQTFRRLKNTYGDKLVTQWTETTDPKKYVYEDCAIAAYLLTLWHKERIECNSSKKQTFADLGCGNGLLVYLLAAEGHTGYGIDLRKRNIWDLYPKSVDLRIDAIKPSAEDAESFAEVDWLIGNHSDELSPWIPVISSRASFTTRYLLIPCCAFEFDGRKYQRRTTSLSQHADFVQYLQKISAVCGFNTLLDRLKIPSTKRICLIGSSRSYKQEDWHKINDKVQEFINESQLVKGEQDGKWAPAFEPRNPVERVRNCTQVDRMVQGQIVDIVFEAILREESKNFHENESEKFWNLGGCIQLGDLIKLIPNDLLKLLKKECGGLQTLLRNNHQIFAVFGGCVQLRRPICLAERMASNHQSKRQRFVYQEKPCWFLVHHPDGCPFSLEECSFKH